ncbi:MAG: tetratricopeptide repeat protein [Desulfobacteraceae bacterium]|nr:tetratricopeptide repeat protein [Desulfobacteraceae bacterium]
MGFLNNLFGKSVETLENEGDIYATQQSWGNAKIKFETALEKLEADAPHKITHLDILAKKIAQCRENLAAEHAANAAELIAARCWADARELLELAGQLTEDPERRREIERLSVETDQGEAQHPEAGIDDDYYSPDPDNFDASNDVAEHDDEQFGALCNTLPDPVQEAYYGYGESFKTGFLALNRGDFETAATALSKALAENPDTGAYIEFELANACLNLGDTTRAEALFVSYLTNYPEALPAYRLLCEIYWESAEFAKADDLLARIPESVSRSVATFLLHGEHLFQRKRLDAAKTFYTDCIHNYGSNPVIVRELAKVCEALGQKQEALGIYTDLIGECTGCGARVEPFLKRKYADLNFDLGNASVKILETYLSLAQEDPANAPEYFLRVSAIYAQTGNDAEARRFTEIAGKIKNSELKN